MLNVEFLKKQLNSKDISFNVYRYSRTSNYYMVSFTFPLWFALNIETCRKLEKLILHYIMNNWSKTRIRRQWFSTDPTVVSFTVHKKDLENMVSKVLKFCLKKDKLNEVES